MKVLANRGGWVPAVVLASFAVVVFVSAGSYWLFSSSSKRVSGKRVVITSEQEALYPIKQRRPVGPPMIEMSVPGSDHAVVKVKCSQCHTTRSPNFSTNSSKQLNEFHQGLSFSHGNMSCLSCHDSGDYDSLKLASGKKVEFSDVMTLCAQCHSQQMKDFEHGAHGGMKGYWDRKKGVQEKNNCIDCHHPHHPQFPKMRPTFKPKDRFLDASHSGSH